MTIYEMEEYLNKYNQDELFYYNYYQAKQTNQLNSFLDKLDRQAIIKRRLIVPELFPDKIPYLMSDNEYFNILDKNSVYLSKHNRYTPGFYHEHLFFEVIYVLKGHCFHLIDTEKIDLETGDFCFVAPATNHSLLVESESIIINILIRRSTIEDIFFNILRDQSVIGTFFTNNIYAKNFDSYLIFKTNNDVEIKNHLLEMMVEQNNNDQYTNQINSAMLMLLLTKLLRRYSNNIIMPKSIKKTSEFPIINYMLDNYATITLESLADAMSYSVPYCSKYIKDTTGYTFSHLLKNIKLSKAEILLKTTNMSIKTISEAIGYDNPENFMRAFKKTYQITPSEFRSK